MSSLAIHAKAENINYFVIGSTAAPFQIEEKNSKNKGIITELVNKLFGSSTKITTKVFPFKRYIKALESSKDPWVTYGSDSWGGPQSWNISKEYLFQVEHVFFSKKGTKINKMSDLFDKRIILITGFEYPDLDKHIKTGRIKVIRVNNHESAISAVDKGRGIAFPEMKLRLSYHLRQMQKKTSDYSLNTIPGVLAPYKIFLAYSKDFSPVLKKEFDDKILRYKKTGIMKKIIDKYVDYNYQVF